VLHILQDREETVRKYLQRLYFHHVRYHVLQILQDKGEEIVIRRYVQRNNTATINLSTCGEQQHLLQISIDEYKLQLHLHTLGRQDFNHTGKGILKLGPSLLKSPTVTD